MFKVFFAAGLLKMINSQFVSSPIGGAVDANNCMIGAGYTWCASENTCIRQWITPCGDNYNDCEDCHSRQRKGENIACPENCDIIAVDPLPPVYIPTIHPTDPLPPSTITSPQLPQMCPEVMCMTYCPHGQQTDVNGCQICQCYEPLNPCPITQPSCDGHRYVCPRITEITNCNVGGIVGHTTYRLSLAIQPNTNIKNVYAIYGSTESSIQMIIPRAYQSQTFQGQNVGGVSDYIISLFPNTRYDSWLTIGNTEGDPNDVISSIGIDFSTWDDTHSLTIGDGAVFLMDPSSIDLSTQGQEIVIAQLTIPTHISSNVIINVQGKKKIGDAAWAETNIQFPIVPPVFDVSETIPTGCISWFDGCNTCGANMGVIGGCTRLMCFREETPRCLSYVNPGH